MWFEVMDAAIAAVGLGLASLPLVKEIAKAESCQPAMATVCFQRGTTRLCQVLVENHARNGESK